MATENPPSDGLYPPSATASSAADSSFGIEAKAIDRLMLAIVQLQDAENALHELNQACLSVTRLATSGGFLGRGNVTLLIGLNHTQEATVVEILSQICRRRIEYIATPLEGAPFHMPLPTPVSVGGATIFTIPVERYEEIP